MTPSRLGMTSARTQARMVERLRESGIRNERVLWAMGHVPRHAFVDEALASRAYDETALPLGHGQTISAPSTVARMTELVVVGAPKKVLEIGTGCGYQAAVLAKLVAEVHTLERIGALMAKARSTLRHLRVLNVRFHHGDGSKGWQASAPYDAILVSASAPMIPPELKEQLAPGGRLVVPVGSDEQHLVVVERKASGFEEKRLEHVKFVPLLPGTM